jgi:hypothetical protein
MDLSMSATTAKTELPAEQQKPLFSMIFLTMQRVYLLSKSFERMDEYADVPIAELLFDGVEPEQYNEYVSSFYKLIGLDEKNEVPTGASVRRQYQRWWKTIEKSPNRRGYLTGRVEAFNTRLDPEAERYRDEETGEIVPFEQGDYDIRHLWSIEQVCAIVCGKLYSEIRTEVLQTPLVDYHHFYSPQRDVFSLNIMVLTPTVYDSSDSDYDQPASFQYYRGALVATTMDALVDNIDRALAERLELIIKKGDSDRQCLHYYEICINQKPIMQFNLDFKGYDCDPHKNGDRERQYRKFNALGTSSYQINAKTSKILNENYPDLEELLSKIPERLHDQILVNSLETDLGL